MRLWHQDLIHYLPSKQLLGQHRECCALRGKGWGKKHSVVDYVFTHPKSHLFCYHFLIMQEMTLRGYDVDTSWQCMNYCGKKLGYVTPDDRKLQEDLVVLHASRPKSDFTYSSSSLNKLMEIDFKVYLEHTNAYLLECITNLRKKGAELTNGMTLNQLELKVTIEGAEK